MLETTNLASGIVDQGENGRPQVRLEIEWKQRLAAEFEEPYMDDLRSFLRKEKAQGKTIFPPNQEIFSALNATSFSATRVVIIGQDPYHGPGQAHGLSFSVPEGIRIPPSLVNIFKELHSDVGTPIPSSGNLLGWARQGVLLLNATLTVEAGKPGSHQNKGWERFTDRVIKVLSQEKNNLVFILWGRYAQQKASGVDSKRHLVISSAHPSPFSAHSGFFGSKPFSRANQYLERHGLSPIRW